ncbi:MULTISPECIES: winged helix-turn-helix domain-containing protein [Methanobacterium]|jgi:DNA-binding transcriptional ArsR family regulator|uniref:Transcriptional regulator n=1 Tax=Methanobacterium subterraneum TaxID=59277 RepID=A0A2H4VBJ4_9EURY|nr:MULTISPECIES: winged helix-turn-helix domain-containing protein [Methanobacterium]MBW4256122.1 winged helix-turn-helix domain-containing protein [Methanobacterium sp. YSL]PKL73909.1 MAG: ArsR family transcriptional regulator [Methanobacteriales archaeon HGW-Methanobacteriales-2]AUB55456.1 transcriptional regulator [Methanobacterium subterraneum]AUB57572.1 transcriptional regulator [Methanobacterium sp. MZ-A1]AUB60696.1 transcriptional regulator [Methanobacterium subterraneum]
MRKLLWWLIAGSTGGPNRAKIILALHQRPYNANQLSEVLNLNYKTIRHHIKVLEENNVITSPGKRKYGEMYFLTDKMEENFDTFQGIWGELKVD